MRGARVVVAMSGGVDSSVAAVLLKRAGYEVMGITMQIWPSADPEEEVRAGGCCSLAAVTDARKVCAILGVPYYVLNFRQVFQEEVIEYFCREYAAGRTPNPCLACNFRVKFEALVKKAQALDVSYVATGHYARIQYDPGRGRWLLLKGIDPRKDQSYALFGLRQSQMAKILMPLGEYTKAQVRRIAREEGLAVWEKPESQEICFIEDDDYRGFLAERMPGAAKPGPILDTGGRVIGEHRGIPYYTIGQRKGLGLAAGKPLYVLEIRPDENAIVVGPEKELYRNCLAVDSVNYIPFEEPDGPVEVEAKIRYNAPAAPATLEPLYGGRACLRFRQPQRAVTPGQAAVFYQGELVVGGGYIEG